MLLGICLLFPAMSTATPVPQSPQASSPLNPDEILKRLASYEYGQNEGVLWDLRNYVRSMKDIPESRLACEAKLLAFLDSQATSAAKMTVCRQLRIIGSEKSVPVLEKLVLQKDTSDIARYALEKIPGEAADKALLKAMASTKGDVQLGVISSLGQRKTQAAVPALRTADQRNQRSGHGILNRRQGSSEPGRQLRCLLLLPQEILRRAR